MWSDPKNWAPAVVPKPGESLVFPAYSDATIASSVDDLLTLRIGSLSVQDAYNISATGGAQLTVTGSLEFTNKRFGISPAPFTIPIHSAEASLVIYGACATSCYQVGTTFSDPTGAMTIYGQLEFVSGGLKTTSITVKDGALRVDTAGSIGKAPVTVIGGALVVGANVVLSNTVSVSSDPQCCGSTGFLELLSGATVAGPITLQSGNTQIDADVNTTIKGSLSGSATSVIGGWDGASLTLSGSTSLTGGLNVAGGSGAPFIVTVTKPQALGTAPIGDSAGDLRLAFGGVTIHNPIGLQGGLHVLGSGTTTFAGPIHGAGYPATIGATTASASVVLAGGVTGLVPSVDGAGTVVVSSAMSGIDASSISQIIGPAQVIVNSPPGTMGWGGEVVDVVGTGSALKMAPGTDGALQVQSLVVEAGTFDIGPTTQTLTYGATVSGATFTGSGTLVTPRLFDSGQRQTDDQIDVGTLSLSGNSPQITAASANMLISSTITGTAGVSVSSPGVNGGVVDFLGNNSYAGPTQLNGVLAVDGNQPQSPVVVNRYAILTGGGTAGAVSTSWGSVLPSGSLHVASATFDANAAFGSFLAGTSAGTGYGQLVSAGPVALADAALELGFGYPLATGDSFTLIANASGQPVQGTFAGLPDRAVFNAAGYTMRVTYRGGASGDDVVLTNLGAPQLVTLDKFGGLHNAVGSSVNTTGAPYWPGNAVARGVALLGSADGGYELDAYGGVHNFGNAPQENGSAYWNGWDIARGIAVRPDGQSGFVLDGYGQLHPFGNAPTPAITGYWNGWDIARAVTIDPCDPTGNSGYVLDGWGGVHPFGGAPNVTATWSSPGHDLAHSLIAECDGGVVLGWVLDGYGGVHTFVDANYQPPADPPTAAHWTSDVARAIVLTGPEQGYVVDAYGGLNSFGGAASLQPGSYWPGWAVVRGAAAP